MTETETTTIVVSIIGAAVGITGVLGLMLRMLTTSIAREFAASAQRMTELKVELSNRIDETNNRIDETNNRIDSRIDETNNRIDGTNNRIDGTNNRIESLKAETSRRFEVLTNEMHQRFDQVNRELGENRERMARLEGSLEGFLAGRRDRDAA